MSTTVRSAAAVRDLAPPRRNRIGAVSLLIAVAGTVGCRLALADDRFAEMVWLRVLAAGFEAAMVGGLADWFAVTALFRHPLGLPIPHTAIIPARRAKITEGIVSMVEKEWLSPEVIGGRLARLTPSRLVTEWLRDAEHTRRLGGPARDFLRSTARLLSEPEVVEFLDRTLRRQLGDVPINAAAGRWLERVAASDSAGAAFNSVALSLANVARRPDTADNLQLWLDRTARQLRQDGKRLIPLILRRKLVQRKIIEAACDYATAELLGATQTADHPLRRFVFDGLRDFAQRLAAADPTTIEKAERVRAALVESLEASPVVMDLLAKLRAQLEQDLDDPRSYLSDLVDRSLRDAVLEALAEPGRRAAFDQWVRATAHDLLRRHHHQIGLTVRENLESLDTSALVAQIEDRVGGDLQFIRLNGAVVGGLIGVVIALVHHATG